jgi:hypothetical protein
MCHKRYGLDEGRKEKEKDVEKLNGVKSSRARCDTSDLPQFPILLACPHDLAVSEPSAAMAGKENCAYISTSGSEPRKNDSGADFNIPVIGGGTGIARDLWIEMGQMASSL